jgi:small subunit ribosomal protein S8
MFTDPIADLLTRIRNASRARKFIVDVPASNMKLGIVQVLHDQGYVTSYKKVVDESGHNVIKIALKYDRLTKEPAISHLIRVSKPGLRQYRGATEVPRVMNGLGTAILSTSRGIITGKKAKELNVGGELLCFVY